MLPSEKCPQSFASGRTDTVWRLQHRGTQTPKLNWRPPFFPPALPPQALAKLCTFIVIISGTGKQKFLLRSICNKNPTSKHQFLTYVLGNTSFSQASTFLFFFIRNHKNVNCSKGLPKLTSFTKTSRLFSFSKRTAYILRLSTGRLEKGKRFCHWYQNCQLSLPKRCLSPACLNEYLPSEKAR